VFGRRTLWATFAVAASAALLFAAPALAAPPANDDFANAQSISLPETVSGTLTDATMQSPDEPDHSTIGHSVASVWYQWTSPATDVPVKLSACRYLDWSSRIAVYTGSDLATLTAVAPADRSCSLKLHAAANTTYRIAVFATDESSGDFQLDLRQLNTPANDDFANPEILPSTLPQTISGTTLDATAEPGEPADSYSGPSASVWYAWTPDADVRAKLELCGHEGAQFESGAMKIKAAVYTGTAVGSLTGVTENLNGCRLNFDAEQGQQYFIVVDTPRPSDEYEGSFQLLLRELAPPSNDDLADAQVLAQVAEQTVSGSTVDSTMEPGEYSHVGRPVWPPDGQEGSVWYQWSSDSKGGTATFDTCTGSGPALQVYSGSAYGALSGASEPGHEYVDWGSCNWTIKAAPSTTYSIAAASTWDGTFDLKVTYQPNDNPPPPPPPGDDPPPGDSPAPPADASAATGQVAGAVKKCRRTKKRKHRRAHRSCAKRAKRLGD
jgi:hypothetical protein